MPEESEYSDDVDFLDTDKEALISLLPVAKNVFNEWGLQINEEKTEMVHFRVAEKDELMVNLYVEMKSGLKASSWDHSCAVLKI